MIQEIRGWSDLLEATDALRGPSIVAFLGEFSEKSQQARPALLAFAERHRSVPLLVVDVGKVRDIHRALGVTMVPTVVVLQDGHVRQAVIGPKTVEEYEQALLAPMSHRPDHLVMVYTTPTCPWCTRVKSYLKQRGVPFIEVDVSRNPAAARALVQKTGHTAVPQLDIDGEFVLGFDRARIDALLARRPGPSPDQVQ